VDGSHRQIVATNAGEGVMPDHISTSPPDDASEAAARIDRRRLRSARTRQAIIEAYVSLVRETSKMPTATRIAERAGCSVRSVFERFNDLHALRVAATDYAFAEASAQAARLEPVGDRWARLKTHVQLRGMICERWLPMWRNLIAYPGDSGELRSRIVLIRRAVLERIELMYAQEFSVLSDVQRFRLLVVIESLIDFENWARMRTDHGLSFEEACAVWMQAIDRLLPPTPVS